MVCLITKIRPFRDYNKKAITNRPQNLSFFFSIIFDINIFYKVNNTVKINFLLMNYHLENF